MKTADPKEVPAMKSLEVMNMRSDCLRHLLPKEELQWPESLTGASSLYHWNGTGFAWMQSFSASSVRDLEFFEIDGVQSIPTGKVMNWEFFEIGGVKFLALAKYRAGHNYDVDSQIYQWNGTAFMNMPSMSLPTRGAYDFEFFEIDNTQYLAVANHRDGGNVNVESYIYRWNGNAFVTFQNIAESGASHWEHFEMDGVHYLALACFYDGSSHNVNSKIYRWDGAEFAEIQSIATIGALDFEFFTRSGAHYLAAANSRDGPNVNVESKLYKWDGAAFVEVQAITTNDAYDWEYFESNCFSYLVAANRGGVTEVFRVERNSSTVCLPDPASPSVEIVSDLADTDIVLNIHVPAIPASTAEGENLTWRFDIGSSMQELRVWGGSECLSWEILQTSENSSIYQVSMPYTKLLQACSLNATEVNRTINSSVSPGYTLLGPGYCWHGYYDGHDATDATLEACKAKCTSEPMCQFFSLSEGRTCSLSFAKETDAWLPSGYRPLGPGHCLVGYYDGWDTDASLEACAAKCTSEPHCQFFSLSGQRRTCSRYLATDAGCERGKGVNYHWWYSFAKQSNALPSGYQPVGPGQCIEGYYAGREDVLAASSLGACAAKCSSEASCQFFVWIPGQACSRYSVAAQGCLDREQNSAWDHVYSFAKENATETTSTSPVPTGQLLPRVLVQEALLAAFLVAETSNGYRTVWKWLMPVEFQTCPVGYMSDAAGAICLPTLRHSLPLLASPVFSTTANEHSDGVVQMSFHAEVPIVAENISLRYRAAFGSKHSCSTWTTQQGNAVEIMLSLNYSQLDDCLNSSVTADYFVWNGVAVLALEGDNFQLPIAKWSFPVTFLFDRRLHAWTSLEAVGTREVVAEEEEVYAGGFNSSLELYEPDFSGRKLGHVYDFWERAYAELQLVEGVVAEVELVWLSGASDPMQPMAHNLTACNVCFLHVLASIAGRRLSLEARLKTVPENLFESVPITVEVPTSTSSGTASTTRFVPLFLGFFEILVRNPHAFVEAPEAKRARSQNCSWALPRRLAGTVLVSFSADLPPDMEEDFDVRIQEEPSFTSTLVDRLNSAVKDGDPTTVAVTAVPLGDLEEASRSSISEVVFGRKVLPKPPDTSMPSPVSPAGAVPELPDAPKAQADMPPLEYMNMRIAEFSHAALYDFCKIKDHVDPLIKAGMVIAWFPAFCKNFLARKRVEVLSMKSRCQRSRGEVVGPAQNVRRLLGKHGEPGSRTLLTKCGIFSGFGVDEDRAFEPKLLDPPTALHRIGQMGPRNVGAVGLPVGPGKWAARARF
ncbi:Tspear [Symbiodinium sp. KB8]|nr:Tspear [Symbiodinium sp. KB8]